MVAERVGDMKIIGVIANFGKERAAEAIRRVSDLARGMGFTVCEEPFAEKSVEAVVVLGGDGTMLDAAHRVTRQNLPLMGLNIGSLGYLTSVEEHQFEDALRELREGRYTVSHRSALEVSVCRSGADVDSLPDALNDVVFSRGALGRAVKIDVSLDEKLVASVLCDGVIVSTPTGSTAYSLSAGGPILLPDTPAIIINMICPHTLTSRPLVVRDTAKIELCAASCDASMVVWSDGRDSALLQKGDSVRIVRSPRDVPLVELHGYNPCDVMRRKLGWGGR